MENNISDLEKFINFYPQTCVLPFFLSDGLGGYSFSATITLIQYKDLFWGITAAHAIPKTYKYGIYCPCKEGGFYDLFTLECNTTTHRFDCDDLIIFSFSNGKFPDRNYFELSRNYSDINKYNSSFFSWIGFPSKKVTNLHNSKKPKEEMLKSLQKIDGIELFTFACSLTANIEMHSFDNDRIVGYESLKNVSYSKDGVKSKGYSFKGMSGGTIFCYQKPEFISPSNLKRMFLFMGMGIEHKDNKYVIGISRELILNRLDDVYKILV